MADPIVVQNTKVESAEGCDGDTVSTSNIYLAAACLAADDRNKVVHEKCDRSDPRRIRIFLQGVNLKKIVDAWWDGSSPYRRYSEKLRGLREIIRPVEVRHVERDTASHTS